MPKLLPSWETLCQVLCDLDKRFAVVISCNANVTTAETNVVVASQKLRDRLRVNSEESSAQLRSASRYLGQLIRLVILTAEVEEFCQNQLHSREYVAVVGFDSIATCSQCQ